MISEYFKLAVKNLKKRKLRSWLTMIGIFASIATIFILISLSLGLQGAVEEQFKQLGSDKFFIQPKTGFLGPPGSVGGTILANVDVNVVQKVSGIKDYSYFAAGNAKVEKGKTERYMLVWGVPPEHMDVYVELGNFKIEEGRNLKTGDSKSVVLGNYFKTKNLLGKSISSGDIITINGEDFKVRGIMKRVGNPDDDSAILMDMDSYRILFDVPERVDMIILQVNDGENILDIANKVEKKLRSFRGLTEKTQDFDIFTPDAILESFKSILNIITYFLAGIAAISLLVGAIGIANTMYTSILERTKEIGVMKAIGAKNSDILWIFLIESGLLGLSGSIVGVLIGMGVGKIIEYIAINYIDTNLLRVAFPSWLIVGCLAFGFGIGIISGALPAYQASKTNVVDALRYE